MPDEPTDQVHAALVALADLCPSREDPAQRGSIPLDWFRWLPVACAGVLSNGTPYYGGEIPGPRDKFLASLAANSPPPPVISIDRSLGERLAAIDQLRPGRRSLRLGWLFVAGRTTRTDGRSRKVFWPLVTRPVAVARNIGSVGLVPAGDVELTRMITDDDVRSDLERRIETGGGGIDAGTVGGEGIAISAAWLNRFEHLRHFALAAAAAAGLPAAQLVPAGDGPEELMRRDGLVVVAGVAVFANTQTGGLSHAASLDAWARRPPESWTAFHSFYTDAPDRPPSSPTGESVESPFLLTPIQRSAVERSRTAPLTAIRGAPGTGKSHTITAIACDALARGDSVLVTAKSDATVDALIDLFERAPGPQPVVFGSHERKDALAEQLAGGLHPSQQVTIDRARSRLDTARELRDALHQSISRRLRAELISDVPGASDEARREFPNLFESDCDLDVLTDLFERASAPASRLMQRRRRRKALAALESRIGAITDERIPGLADALEVALTCRDLAEIDVRGGLEIGSDWGELREATDEVHRLAAEWLELDSRSPSRLDRHSLGTVSALATALRSGRAARREQLSHMGDDLTRALPLWVGTLPDIEDLLPSAPGLFDLVILDEASSIDQPSAASALLRGKRAVIAGDPKQLRHVSFLSDEQRDNALIGAGIDIASPLAGRLDVHRNSAFDVAAGAVPVLTLDEQFRCRPHLVEFVARRLYDDRVKLATRSPATTSIDCIDLTRIEGTRDETGVVDAEIDAVIGGLRRPSSKTPTSSPSSQPAHATGSSSSIRSILGPRASCRSTSHRPISHRGHRSPSLRGTSGPRRSRSTWSTPASRSSRATPPAVTTSTCASVTRMSSMRSSVQFTPTGRTHTSSVTSHSSGAGGASVRLTQRDGRTAWVSSWSSSPPVRPGTREPAHRSTDVPVIGLCPRAAPIVEPTDTLGRCDG